MNDILKAMIDQTQTMLVVMIGPPGSGKTTLAKHISVNTVTPIVSSDEVRRELFGNEEDQGDPEKVFSIVYESIGKCAMKGIDVIYDATNCDKVYRKDLLDCFREYFDVIVGVCYDWTLERCLEWNEIRDRVVPDWVIKNMYAAYTDEHDKPSLDEGFDHLITFTEAWDIFNLLKDGDINA